MLTIYGAPSRYCDGLSRRSFLKIGGLGMGGLSLPELLRAEAEIGGTGAAHRSHKAIIMILLVGGPTHLDTFDLKPDAPTEVRGEFAPIPTNVPGIEICELMPRMARIMDKLVFVRSLSGGLDDHNTHQCVTGWSSHPASFSSPEIRGYPPGGWPTMGSVISKAQGTVVSGVPPAVDLTHTYYDARFMMRQPPSQGGFLGAAHDGFQVRAIDPQEIVLNGIELHRLHDRRALLSSLDRFRRAADADGAIRNVDVYTQQAFSLMTSPRLAEALDLSREDPRVKSRYGLTTRAKPLREGPKEMDNLLMARRAIQAGARLVTVAPSRYPFGRMSQGDYNWDWHSDIFNIARGTLPMVDQGISALVEDLEAHDMLDDVSVVVWGEFGRTPRINGNAGRDHWAKVGSAVLAGGGMKTGQVIGSSTRLGGEPEDRPVHFRDIHATLYHNMGLDPTKLQYTDLAGRPHYLVEGRKPMPELV